MKRPTLVQVGLGKMGSMEAEKCRYLDQMGLIHFAAVSDIDPTKESKARKYARRFYRNSEDMYRKEQPDGVIIATQEEDHIRNATYALEAGITSLFIEKPSVARSHLDRGFEFLRYADKVGANVMVDYVVCFGHVVEKFMRNKGRIGNITGVKVDWEGPVPHRFKNPDVFSDLGVYAIMVPGYILGYPNIRLESNSFAPFLDDKNNDECLFMVRTEHNQKIIGHAEWFIEEKNRRPKIRRTYILGKLGYSVINHEFPSESLFFADKASFRKMKSKDIAERALLDKNGITGYYIPIESYNQKTDDALSRALKHFVKVINTGCEPKTSMHNELKLLKGMV